jgi:DNA-binding NarL/FixJ family response regulator
MFTTQFMPGATQEQMGWFNDLQRISTTGENAARIQRVGSYIDVVARLPEVKAPALVLHAKGDERITVSEGRLIASLIPDARMVELDSHNHLTLADEPAWQVLVSEARAFLAAGEPAPARRRDEAVTDALTARELDVLRLIAEGRSNQEVADTLVISIHTVTNHVKSILSKTGTANRTEAAAYAHRHRLTGSPAGSP